MRGHNHQEVTRKDFMRSWGNPEKSNFARPIESREYRYLRLWEYYDGTAYTNLGDWSEYKTVYGLYRKIRQVWDHAHEIVEFYATHIWSGSLASDGLNLPNGVANAVPLAEDTDPTLAMAIGQLFQWWNFQQLQTTIPRYTAALGELLVEIKDDVASGKVLINLVWPGYVSDVRMDAAGNLKYYCVEYSYLDRSTGKTHKYRREVDDEYFKTFRDDKPYDYIANPIPVGTDPEPQNIDGAFDNDYILIDGDVESGYEIENPYGFVPAVLFRHNRIMGVRGEPAIWSTQAQLDEINSMFAHMMDKAHVSLESPVLVTGNIQTNRLRNAFADMVGSVRRTFTADLDDQTPTDDTLNVLQGPQGSSITTIELKISEADIALSRVIKGIERKCPEVVFYSELRSMTQLTGPSATSLLGDVDRKVRMIASGYDWDLIHLLQMGISVCAFRFAEAMEGWAEKTEEQKKFSTFTENSYREGKLNFDIIPRALIATSAKDRIELINAKKNALPFIPGAILAKEAGYDQTEAEQWIKDYEKKEEEKAQLLLKTAQQQAPFKRSSGAPPGGPGGQRSQNGRRKETVPRNRQQ